MSIFKRLPRPLLGHVLEFVGEKREVVYDIGDGRSMCVLRTETGGEIITKLGGERYVGTDAETIIFLFDTITDHLTYIEVIRDLNTSHPRPNKYAI